MRYAYVMLECFPIKGDEDRGNRWSSTVFKVFTTQDRAERFLAEWIEGMRDLDGRDELTAEPHLILGLGSCTKVRWTERRMMGLAQPFEVAYRIQKCDVN